MRAGFHFFLEIGWVIAVSVGGCGDSNEHTAYPLPSGESDASVKLPPPHGSQDFGNAGSNHVGGPFADAATDPFAGVDAGKPVVSGSAVSEFLSDAGDDWLTLIEADWELDAESEGYLCVRATAPRDAYLHEFAPITPLGTHHTVLTVHPGGEAPDGVEACAGGDVSGHQIYGAGVGTKSSVLPDGIAMQVRAGEQMQLNLHLFNVDAKPLKGRSGVKVRTMDAAEVKNVAEGLLAGPLTLEIPPRATTTQGGQCTFDHDATIFSVGPHMHKLGVHSTVTAHSSEAGEVTLFDGPYEFDSQLRYPVDFVKMKAGDVVQVECTYQNDGDNAVSWGQSSLQEMCFAGIQRFPASPNSSYLCMN